MSMTQPMDNRGGNRPTAPQNNPMNVNPLGGNGQSGNIDYTGFGYGMNQAINQQRQAAPISQARPTASARGRVLPANRQLVGITEPTVYPDEPVTTPSDLVTNAGLPGILPEPGQMLPDDTDTQLIRSYLPAMEFWASMPGTPQTTKDYVRFLRTKI